MQRLFPLDCQRVLLASMWSMIVLLLWNVFRVKCTSSNSWSAPAGQHIKLSSPVLIGNGVPLMKTASSSFLNKIAYCYRTCMTLRPRSYLCARNRLNTVLFGILNRRRTIVQVDLLSGLGLTSCRKYSFHTVTKQNLYLLQTVSANRFSLISVGKLAVDVRNSRRNRLYKGKTHMQI